MFNSLKVAAVEAAAPLVVEEPAVMNEALVDAFIDALPDVPAHMALVADHRQTQTELNALISAIETHGLSKSLVAFAGYDGTLFKVAPSIPALEAFTADLSEEDTAKIVAELKAIDLTAPARFAVDPEDDEDTEVAEEVVLLIAAFLGLFVWIAAFKGFKHWNTTADDKEGRLAKVLPFKTLMDYLHGAGEMSKVCDELYHLELPKTEEECKHFEQRVHEVIKPLESIGIYVDGGHIMLRPFPKAVKSNIESVGYHEGSLSEISEMAERLKADRTTAGDTGLNAMHERWKALPKEERKIAHEGYDLAYDTSEAIIHRVGKVLKLVKSNVGQLKKFYSADAKKPAEPEAPKE